MELWIIAAAWLVWRLWSVLTTPTEILEAVIGRTSSLLPDFSVDQLGSDWVAVRWRYPGHARHSTKHILELSANGVLKSQIEAEKSRRRLVFEDLNPNTEYIICLYAGGRRLAGKLAFHTMSSDGEQAPISEWTEVAGGSAMANVSVSAHHSSARGPKTITELRQEIGDLQAEFAREHATRLASAREFAQQKQALQQQLEEMLAVHREEHSSRAHHRSEIKALEDLKHSLDSCRRAELRRGQDLGAAIEAQATARAQWDQQLAQERANLEVKQAKFNSLKQEWHCDRRDLDTSASCLTCEIENLNKQVKSEIRSLKEAERARDRLCDLISQLEKNTDLASGLLCDSFKPPKNLGTHETRLLDAFKRDAAAETEWNKAHAELEQQYITAYQKNEQANRALMLAQARADAHREAQIYAKAFTANQTLNPVGQIGQISQIAQTNQRSAIQIPLAPARSNSSNRASVHNTNQFPRSPNPSTPNMSLPPPGVSLLPSNLFKDDPVPPSPTINQSPLVYPAWNTHRSRDSSIFFSAAASIDSRDSTRHSQRDSWNESMVSLAPGTGLSTDVGDMSLFNQELQESQEPTSSSSASSPEKSRWGRLKPSTTPAASNFVRRLSFFRKDKVEEEKIKGISAQAL